jgi:hypothetical protein
MGVPLTTAIVGGRGYHEEVVLAVSILAGDGLRIPCWLLALHRRALCVGRTEAGDLVKWMQKFKNGFLKCWNYGIRFGISIIARTIRHVMEIGPNLK